MRLIELVGGHRGNGQNTVFAWSQSGEVKSPAVIGGDDLRRQENVLGRSRPPDQHHRGLTHWNVAVHGSSGNQGGLVIHHDHDRLHGSVAVEVDDVIGDGAAVVANFADVEVGGKARDRDPGARDGPVRKLKLALRVGRGGLRFVAKLDRPGDSQKNLDLLHRRFGGSIRDGDAAIDIHATPQRNCEIEVPVGHVHGHHGQHAFLRREVVVVDVEHVRARLKITEKIVLAAGSLAKAAAVEELEHLSRDVNLLSLLASDGGGRKVNAVEIHLTGAHSSYVGRASRHDLHRKHGVEPATPGPVGSLIVVVGGLEVGFGKLLQDLLLVETLGTNLDQVVARSEE